MNLKPIMEIYFTKIDLVERLWICTSVLFEAEWKAFKTFVFIFEVNIFNISLKMYFKLCFWKPQVGIFHIAATWEPTF